MDCADLLVGKLFSILEDKFALISGVRDEIKKLELELIRMRSFLEDADKRRVQSKTENSWISSVRDMVCEVEDITDESDIKVIGIWGMPGKGKTTIVKKLYERSAKETSNMKLVDTFFDTVMQQKKEEKVEELLKKKSVMEVTKILGDRVKQRIIMEHMKTLQLRLLSPLTEDELQANAKRKLSSFMPRWSCKTENTKIKFGEPLPTAKEENKKKRRHPFNGGPSESDWKRSEGSIEELLSKKSVVEVIQILSDRLNQRINNDKRVDLKSCKIFYKKLRATDTTSRLSLTVALWRKWAFEDEREMQMSVLKISDADMDLLELEKKLFADNNRTVKFSDFEGLEEALLEAPRGEIPKYLKDIASKIEKASGIYKIETVLQNVLILLCAAVHEMENYKGLKQLNWHRLLTWGATYNKAKDVGFQVDFVEKHLKKLLYAYLGFDFKKGNDSKDFVQKLEAELNVIEDCLSAKKAFQGNRLSHGLFPA